MDNVDQSTDEVYMARHLGSSTTVILTFAGPKVPYTVRLYGAEYPCSIYKKTIPVCGTCHMVGHRANACPHPTTPVCRRCGSKHPEPNHLCSPTCGLCGGAHLSETPGCTKRYSELVVLCQRRTRTGSSEPHNAPSPGRGRPQERSALPSERKRSFSRSKLQDQFPALRPPADSPPDQPKHVSWAQKVTPTAQTQPFSPLLPTPAPNHSP